MSRAFTGLQRYHIMDEIQYLTKEPFTGFMRYHIMNDY